jgi:pimeloyl-ACP methyl ester carboxylesterase
MKTLLWWMYVLLSRGALLYLGILVLLMLLQRHFIYFPARSREEDLLRSAETYGLTPWRDSSNRLIGWRSGNADAPPVRHNRLVVFHGNAGYALHRSYYVGGFRCLAEGQAGWEILLFEYPGYGARPGRTTEENILSAGRTALSELLKDKSGPVFLLGESLGSGIAARLAAENPGSIDGLFLVTPFTCLSDVGAKHYPIFPVRLVLRDRYEVQQNLNKYPGPAAFLMAGQDEIVPADLGRRLFENYPGRKRLWIQPGAGHNTLDFSPGASWWREVADFLTAGF